MGADRTKRTVAALRRAAAFSWLRTSGASRRLPHRGFTNLSAPGVALASDAASAELAVRAAPIRDCQWMTTLSVDRKVTFEISTPDGIRSFVSPEPFCVRRASPTPPWKPDKAVSSQDVAHGAGGRQLKRRLLPLQHNQKLTRSPGVFRVSGQLCKRVQAAACVSSRSYSIGLT